MIDGQQSQPLQIDDDGYFVTSFEVSRETRHVTVTLMVSGELPQSPKALGLSADERTLTYFLKSVDLVPA